MNSPHVKITHQPIDSVIYKTTLDMGGEKTRLPEGHMAISTDLQDGKVVVWSLFHDLGYPVEVFAVATGERFTLTSDMVVVGTVKVRENFILHVFQEY